MVMRTKWGWRWEGKLGPHHYQARQADLDPGVLASAQLQGQARTVQRGRWEGKSRGGGLRERAEAMSGSSMGSSGARERARARRSWVDCVAEVVCPLPCSSLVGVCSPPPTMPSRKVSWLHGKLCSLCISSERHKTRSSLPNL